MPAFDRYSFQAIFFIDRLLLDGYGWYRLYANTHDDIFAIGDSGQYSTGVVGGKTSGGDGIIVFWTEHLAGLKPGTNLNAFHRSDAH